MGKFTHFKLAIEFNLIQYFMGGGAFFAPFVHVDRGGCRMSTLVHSRGGGGQNWST